MMANIRPLDPDRLSQIRRKWAIWLTTEIDGWLERYEGRIEQIGAGIAREIGNENSVKGSFAFFGRGYCAPKS